MLLADLLGGIKAELREKLMTDGEFRVEVRSFAGPRRPFPAPPGRVQNPDLLHQTLAFGEWVLKGRDSGGVSLRCCKS
jgi:hypothetical protein